MTLLAVEKRVINDIYNERC